MSQVLEELARTVRSGDAVLFTGRGLLGRRA